LAETPNPPGPPGPPHALVALLAVGLLPSILSVILPSLDGSAMSTPWARMHCANLSALSRNSALCASLGGLGAQPVCLWHVSSDLSVLLERPPWSAPFVTVWRIMTLPSLVVLTSTPCARRQSSKATRFASSLDAEEDWGDDEPHAASVSAAHATPSSGRILGRGLFTVIAHFRSTRRICLSIEPGVRERLVRAT
jgi:hypothetical protein